MTVNSESIEDIEQFLLGNLSEDGQQRIEERLMSEGSFLEELEVCEDELIDDYVNDELDAESRVRFEKHFLCTTDRMQKLKFAMALNRYSSRVAVESQDKLSASPDNAKLVQPAGLSWKEKLIAVWGTHSWAFRTAMTVAVIAIIAAIIWLWIPRSPAPTTFVALNLSISASDRAEGAPVSRITLPIGAEALRISLKLPEASSTSQNYRIELINDKDTTRKLVAEGRDAQSLSVVIPASQLERGDYAIRLFLIQSDGTEQRVRGNYFFTLQ